MGDLTRHFSVSEVKCPCGCGEISLNLDLLKMLEVARTIAHIPFGINSWCRCEKHNKDVGGVDGSSHLKGLAVDIRAESVAKRRLIYNALKQAGFARFGIGRTIIHVDIDDKKTSPATWRY